MASSTGSVALELEHALGFTPQLQGLSVVPDPTGRSNPVIAYGCGQLLVVTDLTDQHRQRLLRGHDAPLTSVDISPRGKFIVSGQKESMDRTVPFLVWSLDSGMPTQKVVTPHQGHIDVTKYSPDEGMIATTGAEGALYIWDAITGSKVASFQDTVSGDKARSVCWGPVENSGTRNQQYILYAAFNTGVRFLKLQFSVKTLSFEMTSVTCQVPGAGGRMGGFLRHYLSCARTNTGDLLCGTTSGDVVVFSCQHASYRTALTLCANGATAVCVSAKYGCVVVAGGDGVISKIQGREAQWTLVQKTQVSGHISSMILSSDEEECYCMTDAGLIYRVLVRDLTLCVALQSPLQGLSDVCIPSDRSDWFASASKDGVIRVWDLSDYSIVTQFSITSKVPPTMSSSQGVTIAAQGAPGSGSRGGFGGSSSSSAFAQSNGSAAATTQHVAQHHRASANNAIVAGQPVAGASAVADAPTPTSIAFDVQSSTLISGWSDGRIRGLGIVAGEPTCRLLWTIPNAHQGRVHTIRVAPNYILSAGDDTTLRIWSRNQSLVAQTQDHKLALVSGMIDNTTDVIVHSVSADMNVASYDLTKVDNHSNVKGPLRIALKNHAGAGGFTCATQRRDAEHELIVGTMEGTILFFDIDVAQAVLVISDKKRSRVTALEVSPNGRWLVGGLADGSIVIYELFANEPQRAALVLQAICHSAGVARCAWTADGRQLVSAGNDGELIVWNFYDASESAGFGY